MGPAAPKTKGAAAPTFEVVTVKVEPFEVKVITLPATVGVTPIPALVIKVANPFSISEI